jgi:hypothetical protein
METYSVSIPANDDTFDSLTKAVRALTAVGFSVVKQDERRVELRGPGLRSTKQNPLLGATKIELRSTNRAVQMDAELGGVQTMQKFLTWFPALLGLTLAVVFSAVGGIIFGQVFGIGFGIPVAPGWKWIVVSFGVAFLPILPWLVLSPLMIHMIRKRTILALKKLLQSAI